MSRSLHKLPLSAGVKESPQAVTVGGPPALWLTESCTQPLKLDQTFRDEDNDDHGDDDDSTNNMSFLLLLHAIRCTRLSKVTQIFIPQVNNVCAIHREKKVKEQVER